MLATGVSDSAADGECGGMSVGERALKYFSTQVLTATKKPELQR